MGILFFASLLSTQLATLRLPLTVSQNTSQIHEHNRVVLLHTAEFVKGANKYRKFCSIFLCAAAQQPSTLMCVAVAYLLLESGRDPLIPGERTQSQHTPV